MKKRNWGMPALYGTIFLIYCCFGMCVSRGMAGTANDVSTFTPAATVVSKKIQEPIFSQDDPSDIYSTLSLAIADVGIFSDLDQQVRVALPPPDGAVVSLWVNKKKRILSILYDDVPVKSYPVALGFSPLGDKNVEGDGRTPEGTYYIVEKRHQNLPAKYGARSMLISYPGKKDAQRGLRKNLISKETAESIERALANQQIPPQSTPLGSSIRIHGGGVHEDWTAGCIALRDDDAKEVYAKVKNGTAVRISAGGGARAADRDGDGIPNQVDIIAGAIKADLNDASYDGAYQTISYPGGDVSRHKGVCTDVVIRAFRNAGIDLQREIHKDIVARPHAYAHISTPSTNIDHRRVKNMVIYMKRQFVSLPTDRDFLPGDVVLFDTLPKKGPDHIGIVSDTMGANGVLMVVNNWTDGAVTDKMDLLSWVPITHHFRLQ